MTGQATHPLDPLTSAEIEEVARLVAGADGYTPRWRFVAISLAESDKAALRAWESGAAPRPPRRAVVVIRDKTLKRTLELAVNLDETAVVALVEVPGVQPAVMREESLAAERLAREDSRWQAALRRRGIADPAVAMLDHMPLGYQDAADGPQTRLGIALTWVRSGPPPGEGEEVSWEDDNGYASPVEGLIVYFDLDEMTILRVEDEPGPPIPELRGNADPEAIVDPRNVPHFPDGTRTSTKPIAIAQPNGPSFTVDGWAVRWEKWALRVGFNIREGLVLHEVGYEDRRRLRRILHRAALSEMFVPYGDPGRTHFRKQLFDEGEAGIGRCVNSLRLGCDCLGEIHYFDAVIHDNDGVPRSLPNAICMHEEDYGIGWKHTNLRTDRPESRRRRRLVISTLATVGNYDYGFFWYLYQDGTIEYEVKLTGTLSTGAFAIGDRPIYGTAIAPGLYAPNHQHWFNVRLHMDVDGGGNSLVEVNSAPVTDPEVNFFGGAWTANATVITREHDARRDIEPRTARYWRVENPSAVNALGQAASYALFPGHNAFHLYLDDAPALKRAAFIRHHLWATAYRQGELHAAGPYPNQHPGGAGLPHWTKGNAPLEDADLVVWYSFVAHHIPRPEDWPIMPVAYAGFELRPFAFFDGNPALDVAPEPHACHAGR